MFEALIQRTLEGLTQAVTLVIPAVRVRFQICPGTDAGLGIQGAQYEVVSGGVTVKTDTTDANGEATIPIPLIQTTACVLRIFGTDYPLDISALQPVTTIVGQQQRLNLMGYVTGYQLDATNDPTSDGNDSTRHQQGIMNFQTDKALTIDGKIGPKTRGSLTKAAGE